jgi:hypothetical protein
LIEGSQPNLQTGNDGNKWFRSSVSVVAIVIFMLAIATLQILSILISETPQRVYGQTQATETDNNYNNNIVRGLSWISPWYDNIMRPTTSNVIAIAASISDNGNINSTPFLLPSPSSSQSSTNNNNNSSTPAIAPTSNTPPSDNAVNSNSPSQGDNSNNGNSTDTHHVNSHSNTVSSSSNNHVQDQHKKHKHGSTGEIIHQVFGQSKQQLTVGDIPFP